MWKRKRHPNSAYKRGFAESRQFFKLPQVYRRTDIDWSLPTALVVGNGPSLSATDPSEFAFDAVYLCNYAHRLDQQWRDIAQALVINPHRQYWNEEVVQAGASMRLGSTMYLDDNSRHNIPESWSHLQILRVAAKHRLLDPYGFPKPKDSLRPAQSLDEFYRYRHTPMLSIQIALHEGYKQIILVGMDHDHVIRQLVDDEPRVFHAYKEIEQERMPRQTYLDLANEIKATWGMYAAISNLAERYGSLILDATSRGHLDVFPRLGN